MNKDDKRKTNKQVNKLSDGQIKTMKKLYSLNFLSFTIGIILAGILGYNTNNYMYLIVAAILLIILDRMLKLTSKLTK